MLNRWYRHTPNRDYGEIVLQLGALSVHLWAMAHHTYRLTLAVLGRKLPKGL